MAVLTTVKRLHMGGRLTGSRRAIVATGAIAGHSAVVKDRPGKTIGVVAIVAGIATGDMIGRLARGHGAIVATRAGALHRGMIDPGHR